MKRGISWLLLGVVLCLLIGAGGTAIKQLQTCHSPYHLLRTEGNEDASAVTLATAGDFASKPSTAVQLDVDVNGIEIIFAGGAAANKTFSWRYYAWRYRNGPAELVAYGTGILGSQAVVIYPNTGLAATNKFYADTLVITGQYWPATVSVVDGAGDDRLGKLIADMCGYEWVYMEITNADGSTGTEAGNVSVYYAYY